MTCFLHCAAKYADLQICKDKIFGNLNRIFYLQLFGFLEGAVHELDEYETGLRAVSLFLENPWGGAQTSSRANVPVRVKQYLMLNVFCL